MNLKDSNSIGQFIKPAEGIKRCGPEGEIGSCVSPLESSHNPVFIFDASDKFLGLLSISEILYKKHLPPHTKAKHCLTPAHYFTEECTIFEAIRLMLESRIYTLPVFNDKKEVIGVIRARDILSHIFSQTQNRDFIDENLKANEVISLGEHETAGEGYNLLREKNISRVVLVDEKGKLTGIVSRKDLAKIFTAPSSRQRFSTRKGNPVTNTFDEEKILRTEHPLKKYATINVLIYSASKPPFPAAKRLLDSKLNSIVLVDELMRPIGLISIRDLLIEALRLDAKADIPIVFHAHNSISQVLRSDILRMTQKFAKKFDKKEPVRTVYLYIKPLKNQANIINEYEMTLQIKCKDGDDYVGTEKGRDFLIVLRKCLKSVEKQERKFP